MVGSTNVFFQESVMYMDERAGGKTRLKGDKNSTAGEDHIAEE